MLNQSYTINNDMQSITNQQFTLITFLTSKIESPSRDTIWSGGLKAKAKHNIYSNLIEGINVIAIFTEANSCKVILINLINLTNKIIAMSNIRDLQKLRGIKNVSVFAQTAYGNPLNP